MSSGRGAAPVLAIAGAVAALAWLPVVGATTTRFSALWVAAGLGYLLLWRQCRSSTGTDEQWWGRLGPLVFVALLVRVAPWLASPYLSDDVARYLWEGEVQRAGFSPYRHAPQDSALDGIGHESLRQQVNHPAVSAAYPPLVQWIFRLTPPSAFAWKCWVLLADLGVLIVLHRWLAQRRQPRRWAALYAFHPLVLLELCGSGHLDAVALFFCVSALSVASRFSLGSGVLCAAAVLCKPQGLVAILPLALRRQWRGLVAFGLATAAISIPFWSDGSDLWRGARQYAEHWEFHGFLFPEVRAGLEKLKAWGESCQGEGTLRESTRQAAYWLQPNTHARNGLNFLFLAFAAIVSWKQRQHPERAAALLLLGFLLTSATVYPWYVTWLVPFLVVFPSPGVLALTLSVGFSSLVKIRSLETGEWNESGWIRAIQWLLPAALLIGELCRDARSGGALPSGSPGSTGQGRNADRPKAASKHHQEH